ncbi:MAG: DUF5682 family protein [Leptolyngbyaceae cyanobacterium bins.59]|nr:DUF5682 family protein [Leptolyngbyaceae cyanobacterium bins.59]
MKTHVFGIRHHGPGSARSLGRALEALQPDIILVEGPPDGEAVLPFLIHAQMRPPVALLVYASDNPHQAVYYPFAVFSPEWQAIRYGLQQQIPVRFMDLPQAHRFAMNQGECSPEADRPEPSPPSEAEVTAPPESSQSPDSAIADRLEEPKEEANLPPLYRVDPLSLLAQATGYRDGERWWEHLVEQRQDSTELFAAILEAMSVLRSEVKTEKTWEDPIEPYREAYMRKTIREAEKEGFQKIAVVCGAWHAPALVNPAPVKEDTALLKGLPKCKVDATWVPWTYGRLSISSGYGAGIESPGWYQHLWKQGERSQKQGNEGTIAHSVANSMDSSIRWLTQVAQLLRKQDLDASSASVIEAVRLAETLAALRDRPRPDLADLNEATQTVLCFGDPLPMQLIHDRLIVGERLGKVPDETPMVPLQQDLQRQQKRLRLKPDATETTLDLDLRKPFDLERSHLLHRLVALDLPWGKLQTFGNSGKGTFRESWRLKWRPEIAIRLIEVGIWGNTLETAATAWMCNESNTANLPSLTTLIDHSLLANLPQATAHLLTRLQAEAAISSDMNHLLAALPPLVNVLRYGTVRQFETEVVGQVVEGLVTRICVGLPVAVASLDDDAAANLYPLLISVHGAIGLLQQSASLEMWHQVLVKLADQQGLHGLIAGRCCRLLFEAGIFQVEDTARQLGLALSTANDPARCAAWVEGFLSGSGLLLLHNPDLWQVLDSWVMQLPPDTFTTVLPLVRRTFSTFSAAERRQMGEQVRQAGGQELRMGTSQADSEFDRDRADAILPLITQLLGISIS